MQCRIHRVISIAFCLMLSLVSAPGLKSQVSGGTIRGNVADTSGAVIPNAQVVIENEATHVRNVVTTNASGIYVMPDLQPGTYVITVSANGFSTVEQSGANLTVGAVLVINSALPVGSRTDKVTVSSTVDTIELGTSELSGVIGEHEVTQLPLNGRDWSQLATLEPGVSAVRGEQATNNRVQQGSGQQMSISGGRPWQNNYLLDGISINDYANGAPGSALGSNLGVDAIKEFSVVSSNYPAQYGRTSGGVINAVTNTGSNAIHGSAYEFLRNSALDGSNYFDVTKPPFRRNQFGDRLAGRLRRIESFILATTRVCGRISGLRKLILFHRRRPGRGISPPATSPSIRSSQNLSRRSIPCPTARSHHRAIRANSDLRVPISALKISPPPKKLFSFRRKIA